MTVNGHYFTTAGMGDDATCENCGIGWLEFSKYKSNCPTQDSGAISVEQILNAYHLWIINHHDGSGVQEPTMSTQQAIAALNALRREDMRAVIEYDLDEWAENNRHYPIEVEIRKDVMEEQRTRMAQRLEPERKSDATE